MKIAILNLTLPFPGTSAFAETGRQIRDWIAPALPGSEFTILDIAQGLQLPVPDAYDGFIISGSEAGVYDQVAWMEPLKAFLLAARDAAKPLVGICFGHQIMAHTFGGHAEKAAAGIAVGARRFTLDGVETYANVWHQDQVVLVPPCARVSGFADYCPVGMLDYEFPAFSMQFHPEYSRAFLTREIGVILGKGIDPDLAERALESMARADVPADLMANRAAGTFRQFA
ncbi:type 1 glutamine amidotransferase [Pseudohoeflea suaedae]|uniref:Type 1 glutamine amidotransferase n=1 Tax=Pseudohoeflea suaedae TaxID=877384 RepID=A0A4R5PNA3_9HYPH|nr:type 1 glutamine amidotransferase [Pseudohoeflea suaedae]TDH38534.1 type 1 glutamine amidotransferase [Pseudohoeflea suaedae]